MDRTAQHRGRNDPHEDEVRHRLGWDAETGQQRRHEQGRHEDVCRPQQLPAASASSARPSTARSLASSMRRPRGASARARRRHEDRDDVDRVGVDGGAHRRTTGQLSPVGVDGGHGADDDPGGIRRLVDAAEGAHDVADDRGRRAMPARRSEPRGRDSESPASRRRHRAERAGRPDAHRDDRAGAAEHLDVARPRRHGHDAARRDRRPRRPSSRCGCRRASRRRSSRSGRRAG